MYPAPSFEIAGTTVLGSSSFVIRLTTRNGGIFLCGRVTITRSVPIRDRDTDKSVSVFGSRFSFRYKGDNETYIEGPIGNDGIILYNSQMRDRLQTRRTKRNV